MKQCLYLDNRLKPAETYTHTHTHTHTGNFLKAFFLTLFSIFSVYSVPSFATGIPATDGEAQPADCDSDTLDTTSGTANLRADFDANTIDLRWYNNNTLLNVSSTSSDKCTYDTTISLPTNPTKKGYTFKGWKVRPEYDFSTLPTNINGSEKWARVDENTCGYKQGGGAMPITPCEYANFKDLGNMEWKAKFSWGTVYGMAKVSGTPGQNGTIGNPDDTSGLWCWCKMTGYIPNGSEIKYTPLNSQPWVSDSPSGQAVNVFDCVAGCAYWILADNEFRKVVFGVTQ